MGAGYAGKNLSSDKAQHAGTVLAAMNDYKASLPRVERGSDSTLFEFKRSLKGANRYSMARGKDISYSLAQLTDADLETMRQYINKKQFSQHQADTTSANGGMNAPDQLEEVGGDGDDTSVLSYDNDDLDEALDTFDVLESSGNNLKMVDVDASMDERTPTVAVVAQSKDMSDTSPLSLSSTGSGSSMPNGRTESTHPSTSANKAGSSLLSLTTSPEGEEKTSTRSKSLEKVANLLSKAGDAVWDLESSLDDDEMPEVLKLPKATKRSKHAYLDPGEIIDEKNEALMGLQRQKVWSYTKNAQLQREVDVLHQQLEALEALDQKMAPVTSKIGPSTTHAMATRASGNFGGDRKVTPRRLNNQNQNQKATTPRVTPRVTPRTTPRLTPRRPTDPREDSKSIGHINERVKGGISGSSSRTDHESRRASQRDRLDPFPSESNLHSSTSGNNNDNNNGSSDIGGGVGGNPHRSAPQLSTLRTGGVGEARRHRPRRNRLTAMPAGQSESTPRGIDSDDSAAVSIDRGDAWRQPSADSDSDNSYIHSLGFRNNKKETRVGGLLAVDKRHQYRQKSGLREDKQEQHHQGRQKSEIEQGQQQHHQHQHQHHQQRRPRRMRPRGFLQPPGSIQSNLGNSSTSESNLNVASKLAPLGSEALPQVRAPSGPALRSPRDRPQPNKLKDLSVPSLGELTALADGSRNTANDMPAGAVSDSDRVENPRRRKGRNVLQNANRRRRNTMDDEEAKKRVDSMNKDVPDEGTEGTLVKSSAGEFIVPVEREDPLEAQVKMAGNNTSSNEVKVTTKETSVNGFVKAGDIGEMGFRGGGGKNKAKLQRVKQAKRRSPAVASAEKTHGPVSPSKAPSLVPDVDPYEGKPWSRELESGWSEVSFVLQRPIEREEDLEYTVSAAEAGLMFANQLDSVAKSLNVLRGTLTRWLLPYDQNTSLSEQRSTPTSVIELMPDDFRGKLTERQVHYLVAGANSVRKLVRIKIADDNDLEQAKEALKTALNFFKLLQEKATLYKKSPFKVLSEHL